MAPPSLPPPVSDQAAYTPPPDNNGDVELGPFGPGYSAGDQTPADSRALLRRVRWRLIPPLFAVALSCQLDRGNVAFASLRMDADLGISRAAHGLGSGVFFLGYLLAQIPATLACVAVGPRTWLRTLLLAWGGVAACFAALGSRAQFFALRFLLGLAEAGAYPAIYAFLALFFDAAAMGPAYAAVASATAAAGFLGGPMAAALLSLDGRGSLQGWRWLFLVEAVPPLLLGAFFSRLVPESPAASAWLSPAERRFVARAAGGMGRGGGEEGGAGSVALARLGGARSDEGETREDVGRDGAHSLADGPSRRQHGEKEALEAEGARWSARNAGEQTSLLSGTGPTPPSSQPPSPPALASGAGLPRATASLRASLSDARVWFLGLIMFTVDLVMNAITFWLPHLIHAAFLTSDKEPETAPSPAQAARAAALSAVPYGLAGVCMLAHATAAQARRERRWHTAGPLFLAGAALVSLALLSAAASPPSPLLAVALLTLATCGVWATHGPLFSWPSDILRQEEAALGFALMKTLGAAGSFCGPSLVGLVAGGERGFGPAVLVLGGVAAAGGALTLLFGTRVAAAR